MGGGADTKKLERNSRMKELMLVFIGGGSGSVVRYMLGMVVSRMVVSAFPYGTLLVNIIACMVLGAVVAMADERQLLHAPARLLLTVGFCGGFSTFSTYSLETLQLLQRGQYAMAALYAAGSVVLCIGAIGVGAQLIK